MTRAEHDAIIELIRCNALAAEHGGGLDEPTRDEITYVGRGLRAALRAVDEQRYQVQDTVIGRVVRDTWDLNAGTMVVRGGDVEQRARDWNRQNAERYATEQSGSTV